MGRYAKRQWATAEGRAAAAAAAQARRTSTARVYALGGLRLIAGRIILLAIEGGAAGQIARPLRLTDNPDNFYLWNTRQAATQFRDRHQLADLHVYDTRFADIIAVEI